MEQKDSKEHFSTDYIRKVNVAGKVVCLDCSQLLSQRGRGKNGIKKRVSKSSHQNLLKLCKTNTISPSIMQPKPSTKSCSVTHGEPLNIHNEETCLMKRPRPTPQIIFFQNKLVHAAAMTVSFLVANLLAFAFASKLKCYLNMLCFANDTIQFTN